MLKGIKKTFLIHNSEKEEEHAQDIESAEERRRTERKKSIRNLIDGDESIIVNSYVNRSFSISSIDANGCVYHRQSIDEDSVDDDSVVISAKMWNLSTLVNEYYKDVLTHYKKPKTKLVFVGNSFLQLPNDCTQKEKEVLPKVIFSRRNGIHIYDSDHLKALLTAYINIKNIVFFNSFV